MTGRLRRLSLARLFAPTRERWTEDGVQRGRLYVVQRRLGAVLGPRLFARTYPDIVGRVHVHDAMLASEDAAALRHYAAVGASAWGAIAATLDAAGRTPASIRTVLDLPCGHGRVTRVLRAHLPHARLDVSDLDEEGARFCAAEFAATVVPTSRDLRALVLPRRYDLIWCGSLLTHLDEVQSRALLAALVGALAPDGIVVFTSHGASCLAHLALYGPRFPAYERAWRAALADGGMAYAPYYDRDPNWGVAFHSEAFIAAAMRGLPARRIAFIPRGWDDHQDVWAFRRDS
jgi:SAM-dependent methyltransferase